MTSSDLPESYEIVFLGNGLAVFIILLSIYIYIKKKRTNYSVNSAHIQFSKIWHVHQFS